MSKKVKKSKKIVFEEDEDSFARAGDGEEEEESRQEIAAGDDPDEGGEKRKRKRKRKSATVAESAEEEVGSSSSSSSSSGNSGSSSGGAADAFVNDKTIYIEGLPFEATEEQVREFMKPAGGVILSMRLPTWQDSGKLRGYGHVVFQRAENATKALELDGSYMMKRYIKVARPLTPRILQQADSSKVARPPGCRTVFVKNLPYDASEEEVSSAFMVCGQVVGVRLASWGHTSTKKGFGYVDFKREDSAEIAVKKTGSLLVKGRPAIIDFETGAPKLSFKGGAKSESKK